MQSPLILHVVHRFDVGGLENGVVNLVNRMNRQDWRHAILSLTDVSTEFAKRVERDDVQYVSLQKGPGHLFRYYAQLHSILKTLKPDVVHTRNLAALEVTVPAWLAGVRARIHGEHGWDVADPHGQVKKYQFIRRAYRPFVRRYVALSRQIEHYLEDRIGVQQNRISQIYNGVDTSRFRFTPEDRRRAADCPFQDPRHWIVGTVGRVEEVKDQLNLARAFICMQSLDPTVKDRVRLAIVGNGSMRAMIMEELHKGGVASMAWLPGSRADIPRVLSGLDCFVLPSLSEGISNTILEAMATGLPVIATKVGGNAELIEDGLTGLLVPPANSELLAMAMLRYFRDPSEARRHGRTARRMVEDRFSLNRMVTDYASLYEGVLGRVGGKNHADLVR